ncbi:MAG: flagellar biosynthesis protein FliL [gamma proteobacterium symbiont of Ctena orbiculata]|uniref:Flagellar protein FliL n=1 Tax=Candidatus Thiodiazotropha taylori TaxID=2792791 RepID=A0A944MD34_9GAMM|nr:flagellar basal body-associated FliL family protein [Candidatus Thiodiazotropha taylori]PUB89153.1 MAG: flagellar biosynthesis protein FliL [gamma proteobacterium symbiont of Ctena orbiculata]MBT2988785.1 flagellar basal body-associated FliL family protein [Candidatus Thiodiazotropha taylori]MBT2998604.1 flagellar basal body-associated FliL family protein [Candidatus Thiodiazotropha taylori]MBT3001480.1 flagellar basal body-associated FliL family protein [Candidatus Thiodiazotropha taylori]
MADEQAAEELDLGEEKSGKSKLIIIIAIVAVLLIGGGVAAYFLLMGGDEATDEEGTASEQTAEAEVEQGPPQYIDMKPPFVVNLPGKPSLLQIGVSVRVRSDEMAEFIKHNDPMIRHNLLNLLSGADAKALKARETKERLQSEMLQELNRVVTELQGPGEVEALYFTSFVMQ